MPRSIARCGTSRQGLRLLAGFAVAGGVFAGCGAMGPGCGANLGQPACTHGPTGAPGGLAQDTAIAVARRLAPAASGMPTVVWAAIERDPFAGPGATDARLVWEVRLQGSFAVAPCPSGFLDVPPSKADPACVDGDGGLDVVVDYFSGELIGWLH